MAWPDEDAAIRFYDRTKGLSSTGRESLPAGGLLSGGLGRNHRGGFPSHRNEDSRRRKQKASTRRIPSQNQRRYGRRPPTWKAGARDRAWTVESLWVNLWGWTAWIVRGWMERVRDHRGDNVSLDPGGVFRTIGPRQAPWDAHTLGFFIFVPVPCPVRHFEMRFHTDVHASSPSVLEHEVTSLAASAAWRSGPFPQANVPQATTLNEVRGLPRSHPPWTRCPVRSMPG